MGLLHAPNEVDLLQGGAGGMRSVGRLERGPELRPDHALTQARDIGVGALVDALQVISEHVAAGCLVYLDDPREIIMPVKQRRALQDLSGHRQRVVDRPYGISRRPLAHLPAQSIQRHGDEAHDALAIRDQQLIAILLGALDRLGDVGRTFDRLMIDLLDDVAGPQPPLRGR